ncbi:uncharacterized protein PGTG_05623 [Puccinia graminis f. sp. tritici CRL 75-36-700-3]|uniref:CxC1-like cysteine cluster associated with KDZ transposases domain-containing protein n=1 Tax=Puccinia graminis f. sp. tritici (strain CRL 75-36-700-3 / race SCCL) TaxID=418459 RepID=E3K4Y7_PUCGT|nr:uncharacterized protein PGTG_05623 [Puccinia graminis f. sp. tritici CRL 75-36-700-3]EFP79302.2 hypothetical protein PGTG_05623 [Puccinia graminis f. sp. tritici CRL 75-36-700-3]
MTLTVDQPPVSGTLAQRIRRRRNADRIAATRARFYGGQVANRNSVRRQQQHQEGVSNTIMNNDDHFNSTEDDTVDFTVHEDPTDDTDWITIPADDNDDFDRAAFADRERWRQEAKEVNWNTVLEPLHAYYMDLKARTKNWTDRANSYNDHTNCKCAPHLLTHRMVDLVDIHGAQPFTLALNEWLEPRSERLHARGKKHARELRKPFSATVDLYRTLENRTDELVFKALRLDPQEILASENCPACFGPRPPNAEDYPSQTRDKLIVCLDGNFQHRHHTKASRDYRPIETPRIFLPPSDFANMKTTIRDKEIELSPPARYSKMTQQADRCADSHKAADDKRNESTWKGCDDTGLIGCCCRHDSAIHMGNIYKSGEQRCLPIAIINKLLAECEGERQIGILYDIGCSLDKYMRARDLLGEHRSRLSFGTSVFHAYVHNWICQLDYHPRLNNGWGLSDGEGLERLWSYLSPLVSPLRYSTRNHRLASIAHRLKYHNWKGKRDLPAWLKRKFNAALKRRDEARLVLRGLQEIQNPYAASGVTYTKSFFEFQWQEQCAFQKQHTEVEQERQSKLVSLYKQEAVVELLRTRLRGPEIFLATEQQVLDLLASINEHSEQLRRQLDELTGEHGMQAVMNDEESKLLLLLWDAKADLFVQAVHIQAENRPITDSKTIGAHLGTKLKEKIFKASQARRPAVKKHIDHFNRCYLNYVTKFPDQTLSDAADYPLTYDNFVAFPLDHRFWNDGLYYHSKAPWAIDADVRAGITATLNLSRVQEEFQLLAQELCRAIGWGVSYYNRLTQTIDYLTGRVEAFNLDVEPRPDHFDSLSLYKFPRKHKYKVILRELRRRLASHGTLMDEWSEKVLWLWDRCQPAGNQGFILTWTDMMDKINRSNTINSDVLAGVDEEYEETVLEVDLDDGEDAEATLISSLGGDGASAGVNAGHPVDLP